MPGPSSSRLALSLALRTLPALTLALSCGPLRSPPGSSPDAQWTGQPSAGPDSGPDGSASPTHDDAGSSGSGAQVGGQPPIVILLIGDGMGKGQLDAASLFAHGATGRLFMQGLPQQAEVLTGSLSGITDSAAAATTLATGHRTHNGRIGLDRFDQPVETLIELAHRLGLPAGHVSTSSVAHATPAAFSAHELSRSSYEAIATDQATQTRPDVMLGGGQQSFAPGGLIPLLQEAGYRYVSTAAELSAIGAAAIPPEKLIGLFAPEHLDYVKDRQPGTSQPSLAEMARAALTVLDRPGKGFFLMIEGSRIDMASHANDLERAILETLAFDETVRAVVEWASGRANATVLVTADHECGGLTVKGPSAAGVLPPVTWRWGNHTNARVMLFGAGPGAERFGKKLVDHRWIHSLMVSRLTSSAFVDPARVLVPDGNLLELSHRVSAQVHRTSFGVDINQLDALWLDADAAGLAIGLEGVFGWGKNAAVILIDRDLGASTGPSALLGAVGDHDGHADLLLSRLRLAAPPVPGFGVDAALVAYAGMDLPIEELLPEVGLRGLHGPLGSAGNLGWLHAATNFGEEVRATSAAPRAPRRGEGYEAFVPWPVLYPELLGKVPKGATLGISVVLVNSTGEYTSNQALPPFQLGEEPGLATVALPGAARFVVDSNGDGIGDGDSPPTVAP